MHISTVTVVRVAFACDWPQGQSHAGGERLGELSLCAHHKGLAELRLRMGYANALPGGPDAERMRTEALPDPCPGCRVPASTVGGRYCGECRTLALRVGRVL